MKKFIIISTALQVLCASNALAHAGPHGAQPLAEQIRHFALQHWVYSIPLAILTVAILTARRGKPNGQK